MSASFFDRLRDRAAAIHVEEHLRARIERREKLRVKLGLDPTAPDLHVGHLVVLDALRLFQEYGHTVVLIVGDYTAMIGDPSGRSETRPMLTREQVDANAKTYFDQAFLVLDREQTEIHGNSEWLAKMAAADVLRLTAKATLQQVLQREDFASRLRDGIPIGAHEILYPFSQAYDSVAVKADVEIGGTDQLFNLLFGREIQKAYGQEPQDIAVFPLLEGLDGAAKMSKSLGNYIGLTESPEEIYGKTMSIPDPLIRKYWRNVSGLDPTYVDDTFFPAKPRDAKAALAKRLVLRLHGDEAAAKAEAAFDLRHRYRDPEALAKSMIEDVYDSDRIHSVADVALHKGWAQSFSQVKRVAEQGGLRVNGAKVGALHPIAEGDLIQYGKNRFSKVHINLK